MSIYKVREDLSLPCIVKYLPTRLYIKRHIDTGLKYFGKYTGKNILKYLGSGVYWSRHIEKYGESIETIWTSDWFYDPIEIQEFALAFSELFDIVESSEWANIKPENGIDGGWSHLTKEHREKAKETRKTTVSDPEWIETKGRQGVAKAASTKNDPVWKETTGKEAINKAKVTMSTPEWKSTKGVEMSRKMSERQKGENNHWHGKNMSDESKNKISIKNTGKIRTKFICQHCGKTVGGITNFNRWHNNNCKQKK